jgi:type III pantothenate kinase
MLLVIDIGNSTIKFGIYDGSELVHRFAIPTHRDYVSDELFLDRFQFIESRFLRIDRVIASSVVPEIEQTLTKACLSLFKVTPKFIDSTFDHGLKIAYEPPEAAGSDRLVNAFAAASKYGKPIVVCSLGTATTVDAVTTDGTYIGGMIAPGMATMSEALRLGTSKLPQVKIKKPERVIGNTTDASIRSGIYYGYVGLVESLVKRVSTELFVLSSRSPEDLGGQAKVVATGGFSQLIAGDCPFLDIIDENLTLDGLRMLAAEADRQNLDEAPARTLIPRPEPH